MVGSSLKIGELGITTANQTMLKKASIGERFLLWHIYLYSPTYSSRQVCVLRLASHSCYQPLEELKCKTFPHCFVSYHYDNLTSLSDYLHLFQLYYVYKKDLLM